jgi:glycerate-2-kinase
VAELLDPVAPGAARSVERLAEVAQTTGQPVRETLLLLSGGVLTVQVAPIPGTGGVVTFDDLPTTV